MKLTQTVRNEAEKIVELTVEQGFALPGLLGRSVGAHLKYNGWRAVTVDGVKTLYVKKEGAK